MQSLSMRALVADDFIAVDEIIRQQIQSKVALVQTIGDYIISAGGKRLRPLLVLLGGRAVGYHKEDLRILAATIELLHTATLLHDDVVDKSGLRRGRATANAQWGNAPSVLVGDYLYSRSFEMMVGLGNMPVMKILSQATRIMAEGEALQLSRVRDVSTSEETYMQIIRSKTSVLLEASSHSAAVLASATDYERHALRGFGEHLGIAFQLIDDVLDFRGDSQALGKNIGDDLAEGKPTLPLIFTMREGNAESAKLIHNAILEGGSPDIEAIRSAVETAGGLEYTANKAHEHALLACHHLDALPDSPYRQALHDLSHFAVARSH
ncbi:Polyprenyl synthetase [gamma proteobacterium HdN1]|nr:Polyprenyl synthetase [gamma proteobacterium HdN1]